MFVIVHCSSLQHGEGLNIHSITRSKEQTVPDLLTTLKQCGKRGDLRAGKAVHLQAVEANCHTNTYVSNALITMYSRCGSMQDAQRVFNSMPHRTVVSWNSLIQGYVENGESTVAMEFFMKMDTQPSVVTFIFALKACMGVETGLAVHRRAKECGLDGHVFVANSLIEMYCRSGCIHSARAVFDSMPNRGVVSWNVMILGYVEYGESLVAMDLFTSMDCQPDAATYVAVLKACTSLVGLEKGMAIHRQVKERGFIDDMLVATNVVEMYSKCGCMEDARSVFDSMSRRDSVSWNVLVLGYVENGESVVAMELLASMDSEPSVVTFVAALKACSRGACLERGMAIHRQAREYGFDTDIFVGTCLVDMYSKCGSMADARCVFDGIASPNAVTWSSLVMGYVDNGEHQRAIEMFACIDGQPGTVALVAVLKACAEQGSLEVSMFLHGELPSDADMLVSNTLMDMYSKCGSMSDARAVFESMHSRNVVSWNILIMGYAEDRQGPVALELLSCMDCEPSTVTFVGAIKACQCVPLGQRLHARVCRVGLEGEEPIATALLDLYGRCGNTATAEHLFTGMHLRTVVSWNALLSGHVSSGDAYRVFAIAMQMQDEVVRMDDITFVLVLTACSRTGMVEEGKRFFKCMPRYGVSPNTAHYTCIVDMLARANKLEEALSMVNTMPFSANHATWTTLLGACRNLNDMDVGKVAFQKLVARDKQDASPAYVLMGDMYKKLK